jgi:hypothetical protein
MSLSAGDKICPYKIFAPSGSGGDQPEGTEFVEVVPFIDHAALRKN